ncbi:Glycosyltransferase involved in cell wall bisynthesis [Saccharicrinis carchari]|uniref:Glycosyltransferase involved in cell wall bisynthesis n=1 Tax=Saccharicrinis carchari TaxID=1168039 RepID=A0A521C2J2_SACCC|nr:glycosyltransferase [Saccharicrinis carchari]SMO53031.1 Glycosyltransferase involved in cell wall bisynthesis [Saccharicrinis carchari]
MNKLKILFVYSSQDIQARTHLVTTQGESLEQIGCTVDYYDITGVGYWPYLKHIVKLRKFINAGNYDIVHAQFGYSGITCAFASSKPLVVSLMGSDYRLEKMASWSTALFARLFWDFTIVKSQKMYNNLRIRHAQIIPNGINFSRFKPIDREIARSQAGFNSSAHVLWVSDPQRKEKNFALAREAFSHINTEDVELTIVNNVEIDKVPSYYYAADVLLLTSKWEGSPNVIKEAMACSLPIVSTDVGDVADITQGIDGCFIVPDDPEEIARALDTALHFGKRTKGRDKVKDMDVDIISQRLLEIYNKVLKGKYKKAC